MATDDTVLALTAEEFERFERNEQPADWIMVKRLKLTIKLLMQVERASTLLCKYQPGVYDNIERALKTLWARRTA